MPNAALACEDVVCDFCGSKRRVPGTLWLGRFCFVRSKKWPNCAAHQTKKSRKGHPRRFLSWLLPRRGFLPRHDAARLGDHDARASRRGALRAVSRPRRALVRRRARHLGDLLGASRPRLSEARRSLRARSSRLDPRRPPPPPPPRARVSLRHGGVRGGAPRRGRARAPPRPPRRAPGGLPPTLRRDGGARARPDVALRRVGRAAESNGGEFSTRTHATVPPFPRSARVAPRRCSVRDGPPRRRRRRVRRVRLRARLPQIPTRRRRRRVRRRRERHETSNPRATRVAPRVSRPHRSRSRAKRRRRRRRAPSHPRVPPRGFRRRRAAQLCAEGGVRDRTDSRARERASPQLSRTSPHRTRTRRLSLPVSSRHRRHRRRRVRHRGRFAIPRLPRVPGVASVPSMSRFGPVRQRRVFGVSARARFSAPRNARGSRGGGVGRDASNRVGRRVGDVDGAGDAGRARDADVVARVAARTRAVREETGANGQGGDAAEGRRRARGKEGTVARVI